MTFGQAMTAAALGRLVRRPDWFGNWHCRVFAPIDSSDPDPRLLMSDGWPYAVTWYQPDFDADDILAEDWVIVDPVEAIASQAPEIIPVEDDDEEDA